MAGIKYGEFVENEDLRGLSIAEVRKQFEEESGLPENTAATLNGGKISRKKEAETVIGDEDELVFIETSRKGLLLLSAFILSLALTASLFVATFTVRSTTITVAAATNDFAAVTTNSTPTAVSLVGSHTGTMDAATLFDITGDAAYTGDLSVTVSLVNADELVQDYRFWLMRLQYVNASNVTSDMDGFTRLISLENPTTSFTIDSANVSGSTFYLRTPGTIYRTLPFALGSIGADPQIFIEVLQTGSQ